MPEWIDSNTMQLKQHGLWWFIVRVLGGCFCAWMILDKRARGRVCFSNWSKLPLGGNRSLVGIFKTGNATIDWMFKCLCGDEITLARQALFLNAFSEDL